ncbi:MAG: hypothetical protein GWN93_27045 [Deltaproteobacteria bacterium]|nr:hypothetical protein [Deltaproteobacteria bacterium]
MAFGVTDDGFVTKRLQDIKTEIEDSIRDVLGTAINLLPTESLGQVVGILSEREALLWELAEDVYNSQYPGSASGASLDYVVSLTGIERLGATFSQGVITCFGTQSTIIPAGSVVSVAGNPDARFETDGSATIGPGTDEVQTITFSGTPTSGEFTLIFSGEETAAIQWDDAAIDVQNALNALSALSAVTVSGSFGAGFVVTFAGADGEQPQPDLEEGNTNTLDDGSPVTISIAETTPGKLPNVDVSVTAETAGAISALAGTLTVIETVVAGWDSCTNAADIVEGKNIETDAELRVRRLQTLSQPGSATVDAIRAKILSIDEVKAAVVFENIQDVTDGEGRPPHSIAPVVLDGDDNDIALAIQTVRPAGIQMFGDVSVVVQDSQGFDQEIKFSRPTEIDIYLEVDIKTDSTFPTGGEDAITDAILDYAGINFSIADDVITSQLYCPIHEIQGVTDIDLRIDTSNIPLVQKLTFDADFVTGNAINGKIAGSAITPVPFNTTHAQTLSDLAAEIQSDALITTAAVTGAREITVTSAAAGSPGPLSDFVVTGGATQPVADVETTSHSDDNIPIAADEISSWDSTRIKVTKLL